MIRLFAVVEKTASPLSWIPPYLERQVGEGASPRLDANYDMGRVYPVRKGC